MVHRALKEVVRIELKENRLDTETSLAPMASFCVVADGVASSQANPLRNGTILLLSSRKLLLGPEGLVGRHCDCLCGRVLGV